MTLRIEFAQTVSSGKTKRYYKPFQYPEIPLSPNDVYITTTIGDRLDLLANQFYKDVDLWWIIATANPNIVRRDGFNLKGGLELRIPSNYSKIINDFRKLNNPE